MQVGPYRLKTHNHGFFLLDGGAMFGSVPKTLWERESPADSKNRIRMASRSLIVEDGPKRLMIDAGCGDKWTDKMREIFGFASGPYEPVPGIVDLLLTHLHFDHAGGASRKENEGIVASYPGATHYVSAANLTNAKSPGVRERASYLQENIEVLSSVGLRLTEDGDEVWPHITVHQVNGHTRGLQWVKVSSGERTVAFPSDLMPTSKHLMPAYAMGYDICAETSVSEKQDFLEQAVAGDWIVVFQHDPDVAAARLGFDDRGRPFVRELIEDVD